MSGDMEAEGALTPPAEDTENPGGLTPSPPRSTDSEPAAPGPLGAAFSRMPGHLHSPAPPSV